MRNLTIKRKKSAAACLVKMNVYIEDSAAGKVKIDGVPCRKIGTLKNGEEKVFVIDENERKVFVVEGMSSRYFCNDYYRIPSGQEDVFLSGENTLNLIKGNPFLFDGVTDEEVLNNRKKYTLKGTVIMVLSMIVGVVIGTAIVAAIFGLLKTYNFHDNSDPVTFTVDNMQITLDEKFKESSGENCDAYFETSDISVFVSKVDFTLIDGLELLSVAEYADVIIAGDEDADSSTEIKEADGLTYFEYQSKGENYTFLNLTAAYKSDDAFWVVEFVTLEENSEKYREDFIEWAQSVEFT